MRIRRLITGVAVAALALTACTGSDGDTDTDEDATGAASQEADGDSEPAAESAQLPDDRVAAIKEAGALVVGSTLQFEPQSYRDENNEPAGYDMEVMAMMADDLGVELDVRDMEFDALIPGMLAGEFDVITIGLVNRPARAEQLWFTRPYIPYRQVAVINDESGIGSLDDLNSSDVTMTALVGSTAASLIAEEFPEAELVELEQQAAFLEVASGRADAVVVEEFLALPFVEENSGVSILNPDQPFSQEYGRLAVPRGDVLWLEYVDNWLDYYTANGTLDRMYEEIIGPTDGLPQ